MRRIAVAIVVALVVAAVQAATASAAPPKLYATVQGPQVTAPASLQTHGVATCPTGTVVFGGGVAVTSSSLDVSVNGSYPEGMTAWGADVNNVSGASVNFNVWAVCAKKNAAYVVETSPFAIDAPPGGQSTFTEPCPIGTKVLGGGAATNSASTGVSQNSSYPVHRKVGTSTQYSWQVVIDNTTTSDWFVTPVAVCGTTGGYKLVRGTTVANSFGQQTHAHVNCQSPKVPLSGGVRSNTTDVDVDINRSYPSGTSWSVAENNPFQLTGAKITPYAICAGT